MGLSVANILLEVTGDSSSAKRELEDVARDLALFGREEAEAEAYVDTSEATVELDELKAKLAQFSADDVSTEVNLKIAKAQADLTTLQAELSKVDGENVTVDIDVKRGIVDRVGSLARQIDQLGKDTERVSQGALSGFISKLQGADFWTAGLGGSFAKVASIAAPLLIAAVVAVAGQIAAIVGSAANAVGGLGALAVAFGATIPAAVALGIGAILRFKDTSGEAGTAAHRLAETFKGVGDAFKNATAGGADAIFRGLSDALKDLKPLVQALGPAFTRLGKAGGDAFRLLGEQFSSPAWRKFFIFTTDSLAKLTPLFARSFGAFAKILANIATAAMPFLIQGFRLLAKGLEAIAGKTSDIKGLGSTFGGMVDSLKAWGHLLGGVVKLIGAFVQAFAPIGDKIVKSLGDGAEHLAEWLQSKEGLERIKTFFEETGPLAVELGKFFLNLGLIFIQVGQFFAPLAAAVLHGMNSILGVVSDVIDWLTKIDRALAVKNWGSAFSSLADSAANAASDAFDWIKGAVEKVAKLLLAPFIFVLDVNRDVLDVIRDIWNAAKGIVSDVIDFVLHAPRDVLGVVRDIWRAAKGVVSDVIQFVLHAPREVLGPVRDIWRTAKGIVTDVIDFVLHVSHDAAGAARGLWQDVKGIVNDAISFVFNLPNAIVGAAHDLWQKVKDAVSDGINLIVHLIPDVSGLPGKIASTLGFANGVEDLLRDTLAMVGERGPELAFLPQGTDIYTAGETRNILKALGRGSSMPAAAASAGGGAPAGGGHTTNHYDLKVIAPGTGSPDPEIALALLGAKLRARGGLPA